MTSVESSHNAPSGRPERPKGIFGVLYDYAGLMGDIATYAMMDPLTGVLNHRSFQAEVEELIEGRTPFGVIMLDLDNFKLVNDTLGHNVGDEVLTTTATYLGKTFQREGESISRPVSTEPGIAIEDDPEGLVGRRGGDEFGVIVRFRNASETTSLEKLNKEMDAANEHLEVALGGLAKAFKPQVRNRLKRMGFGVSHGSAVWRPNGHKWSTPALAKGLIRRADREMYTRKNAKKES